MNSLALAPTELVRTIIASILPEGLDFSIDATQAGQVLVLTIRSPQAHAQGIILGRGGRNIEAIRRLVTACAAVRGITINLHLPNLESTNAVRSEPAVR